MSSSKLFSSYKLGPIELRNRIVMAPMTRNRALPGNVPNPLAAIYYQQRSSAGLIVTEATQVTPEGIGYPNTPGIHSEEQVEGWKKVTNVVHDAGGRIFLQLWHVGRVSHELFQPSGHAPVAPSAIPIPGEIYTPQGMKPYPTPRPLELKEIPSVVEKYRLGTVNAKKAGFDGVEIHGANGYLIDQFLQTGSNQRTDAYGGSVENRARFLLEVTDAVVSAWDADHVGVRLSPNGTFNGMVDANPTETFTYAIKELDKRKLVYLHLREGTRSDTKRGRPAVPLTTFRPLFHRTLIVNDGYTREKADATLEAHLADLIAFGTPFIANPDLPKRLETGAALAKADSASIYGGTEKGYTDYAALA